MFCLTASLRTRAGVAELVDARDSKSRFFGSVGSSPTTGTISLLRQDSTYFFRKLAF